MGEVDRERARVKNTSIGIAFVTFATKEDAKIVSRDHRLGNCACFYWAWSFLPNSVVRSICCCGNPQPSSRWSYLFVLKTMNKLVFVENEWGYVHMRFIITACQTFWIPQNGARDTRLTQMISIGKIWVKVNIYSSSKHFSWTCFCS